MRRGVAICSFRPRTVRCASTHLPRGKTSRCSAGCYYRDAATSAAARSPLRLFLVELISALFLASRPGACRTFRRCSLCGLLAAFLLPLAMIDWQHQLLPDCLTQPLLWAGLVLNAFDHTLPLRDALFGAVAGYLSLLAALLGFSSDHGTRRSGLRGF